MDYFWQIFADIIQTRNLTSLLNKYIIKLQLRHYGLLGVLFLTQFFQLPRVFFGDRVISPIQNSIIMIQGLEEVDQ